ncbi:hypothetical protein SLEP1_g32055 [Rubroshorea leprosula]|uniref:F-box protein n=1 Tax=Rubroshorea leprosula TaxID=152421 RepID=A0AAV5KCD6_9ROSI|nr:hypothetical protein SLEP1_g32055 [Rubroshorea leprosula]
MISEDDVLNIVFKLEDDPRNWARLACVCTKFSFLIRNACLKQKRFKTIPAVSTDLLTASYFPPGGWAALHKLAIYCRALLHAGVLFEHADFGLDRKLGPDENYHRLEIPQDSKPPTEPCYSKNEGNLEMGAPASDCSWSLFNDLYFDTVYNASEYQNGLGEEVIEKGAIKVGGDFSVCKKGKIRRSFQSHLASTVWNLSREQGNKLVASRFRAIAYTSVIGLVVFILRRRETTIPRDFPGFQELSRLEDDERWESEQD